MKHRPKLAALVNDERGGTTLTVVSMIVGVLLILLGLLLLALAFIGFDDGSELGFAVAALLMAAVAIAGGILLFILPLKLRKAEAGVFNYTTAGVANAYQGTPPAANIPMQAAVSPMGGAAKAPSQTANAFDRPAYEPQAPQPTAHASAPSASPATTSQQPASAQAPTAKDTGAPLKDPTEEIASLVTRSDDVIATLKDLTNHELENPVSTRRHLADMLQAAGLLDWQDAPSFGGCRLSRNHQYWLRCDTNSLSEEDYDRLITIEGALNVNQNLGPIAGWKSVDDSCPDVPSYIMSALSKQTIKPYNATDDIAGAYPGISPEETPGEWVARASFVTACECAVTPFRVEHDHRCNVATRTMVVHLMIPRPRCMAIFTSDPATQVGLARSYALRLATLLASQALSLKNDKSEARFDTVIVNCHEHKSDQTILSIRFNHDLAAALSALLEDGKALVNDFPTNEDVIRKAFDANGWFTPVEPFMTIADEQVSPAQRFIYPELNDNPVSEQLQSITGARIVADFGINEAAGRLAVWNQLSKLTWETTADAVSSLIACRDSANDITVAEACNQVIEALLAGNVDAGDKERIYQLIVKGSTLEKAVAIAEEALAYSDNGDDPGKAVSVLTEALSPLESLGVYLDDADTVFRYFGSIAERIRFNLDIDDHQRAVRLVPDAYYNALSNLSIAYTELGDYDSALRTTDEMIRIAPASIHAALRKVRVLERQSRIFEAADLIKSILHYASTPRDAAVCHYRLAYLEWKLGREDLAVACYQRSLQWDTEMSQQASEELDDLLSSNDSLHRYSEEEICNLLAAEAIPLGCDEADIRRTLAAAVLSVDEEIFWVSRPLVGILFASTGDDVQAGIYRSLIADV